MEWPPAAREVDYRERLSRMLRECEWCPAWAIADMGKDPCLIVVQVTAALSREAVHGGASF